MYIFSDGLCEPRNPGGFACWAWAAYDESGQEITNAYDCIGFGKGMTNNLAEYQSVLEALRFASKNFADNQVQLFTDSQLVVAQVNGTWACNSPHLQPLCAEAKELLSQRDWALKWIPRQENFRADQLTRIAYREARAQQIRKS